MIELAAEKCEAPPGTSGNFVAVFNLSTHAAVLTGDTGALDSGGYPSNKVITTYSGAWYDGANRPIRSAQFGTNAAGFQSGGSVPTISQSSPPSADPNVATRLVTETHYNVRGLVDTVVDPAGRMTQFRYDDMNRRIAVIENADPAKHPPRRSGA